MNAFVFILITHMIIGNTLQLISNVQYNVESVQKLCQLNNQSIFTFTYSKQTLYKQQPACLNVLLKNSTFTKHNREIYYFYYKLSASHLRCDCLSFGF